MNNQPERLICVACNEQIQEDQPYFGDPDAQFDGEWPFLLHPSCWLQGDDFSDLHDNIEFLLCVVAAGIHEFRNDFPEDCVGVLTGDLVEMLTKRLAQISEELDLTKQAASKLNDASGL